MDVSKLNSVSSRKNSFISFKEFKENTSFIIESFVRCETVYGDSVKICARKLPILGEKYFLFLPKRYGEVISDEDILNYKPGSTIVQYKGLEEKSGRIILEFKNTK